MPSSPLTIPLGTKKWVAAGRLLPIKHPTKKTGEDVVLKQTQSYCPIEQNPVAQFLLRRGNLARIVGTQRIYKGSPQEKKWANWATGLGTTIGIFGQEKGVRYNSRCLSD